MRARDEPPPCATALHDGGISTPSRTTAVPIAEVAGSACAGAGTRFLAAASSTIAAVSTSGATTRMGAPGLSGSRAAARLVENAQGGGSTREKSPESEPAQASTESAVKASAAQAARALASSDPAATPARLPRRGKATYA